MEERYSVELYVVTQRMARAMKILERTHARLVVLRSLPAAQPRNPIANVLGSPAGRAADLYNTPIVDLLALTVTWRGKSCFVGNNNLLKLMDRLVRRPDQYIPADRLISEVWKNSIVDDTFRSTVRGLKNRLRQARMGKLAAAIRSNKRTYGLMLTEIS